MTILIFLIISYILLSISLYLLFPKAGVEAKLGLIPGVNFAEWCEIIGRKRSYAWWLLFPIVNIFIFCGMAVDMVRSFGKLSLFDSALAVIYAPLSFYLISRDKSATYLGKTLELEKAYQTKLFEAKEGGKTKLYEKLARENPYKKSVGREWFEAMIFAVFAAAFIRMFLIELYTIPTPSMEGSLKVGDYLFVSKAHYGIRTPQTVLQIPLLHNRIPGLNKESYLSKPSLPYFRLPGLTKIKHNDPVVFNWPIGDKVYLLPSRSYSADQIGRDVSAEHVQGHPYVERPMDKTDFYIKRCVGLPGDSLEIINKQVYINGQPADNPKNLKYEYRVQIPNDFDVQVLHRLDVYPGDINGGYPVQRGPNNRMHLTNAQVEMLQAANATVLPEVPPVENRYFPHDLKHFPGQSANNYGPIWIPKAGTTIELTLNNIAMFSRIIDVYENHELEIKGNQIFIDGREAKNYTFTYDYYWMMGDNRNNSEDSRFWGFVPETHIVGKPLLICFSTKYGDMANGIRWNRIFKGARQMN